MGRLGRLELLSKFIQLFPSYADQIQYSTCLNGLVCNVLEVHLISGDILRFEVIGNCWNLGNVGNVSTYNYKTPEYDDSGDYSGLYE